jgi:hypothetical protein
MVLKSEMAVSAVDEAAKAVLQARAKAENLRKAAWEAFPLVGGLQVSTVDQAQALVDAARSDRFWARSEGCTKTKGKDTSKFCLEYRQALGAKSDLERRAVVQEEFKTAEQEVKAAEAAQAAAKARAGGTKIVANADRSDLFVLTKVFKMSEADAEQFSSFYTVMIMSILWSLGWARYELPALQALGPRKHFNFGSKIKRSFMRTFFGREPKNRPRRCPFYQSSARQAL